MSRRKQAKPRAVKSDTAEQDKKCEGDRTDTPTNSELEDQLSEFENFECSGELSSDCPFDDNNGEENNFNLAEVEENDEDELDEMEEDDFGVEVHSQDYQNEFDRSPLSIHGSDPISWRDSETPDDQSITLSLSPLSCATPNTTPTHTPTPHLTNSTMTGSDTSVDMSFTIGVTESTPYSCQFCEKAFPRLSFLKRHEQTHSDQMPFKCNYCQRLFKHKRSRDRHIKLHTGDRKYRCNQCEAAFCRSDHLKIHMKTHDNAKPFQCTVCNRGYNTAAALTAHTQNHKKANLAHSVTPSSNNLHLSSGTFRCLQCTAVFNSPKSLQSHMLTHQIQHGDSASHPTGRVDIVQMESPNLPQNQMLSRDNGMLQCLYCGQLCLGMNNLMLHIEQLHTGSSDHATMNDRSEYRCPICNDTFLALDLLYKHMKVHEEQILSNPADLDLSKHGRPKLYCIYCPKGVDSFMTFEALQLHIQLMHGSALNGDRVGKMNPTFGTWQDTQQRPTFACEMCTLKFTSVQTLQKHTLTAHSFKDIDGEMEQGQVGETYCSQCKKTFHDNKSLLNHIKTIHETGCDDGGGVGAPTNSMALTRESTSPVENDATRGSISPRSPNSHNQSSHSPSEGKAYLCSQCNASFADFESFRTHLKTHLDQSIKPQVFSCSECKVEFSSEDQLDMHIISHYLSTSTEYGCQCCMKLFTKPDELQKHLMDIHAHHLYRCSLCRQIFDSKVGIQVHFAVKHSNECKIFKCNLCNSFFRSEMEFHLHVKVAHLHKAQPYRCLFCHLSFSSEIELQYHLTTHKKQFTCKLCDEAFHVEFLLDKHMHTKHSQSGTLHHQSSAIISSPSNNNGSSNNNKPSVSTSSSISSKDSVKNVVENFHAESAEERGSDRKDVKCEICDAIYPTQTQLLNHRRQVHNVIRSNSHQTLSLQCAYCNESCKSRTELENHMKSHTATTSGKHKCNVCDEICPSATILAEHKLQHCKVLTSSLCVTCKNHIRNDQQFYSHIQQHNGHGFPTPCVICRQTLTSEVEIQVHSKFHLKNSNNQLKICSQCNSEAEVSQLMCVSANETADGSRSLFLCKDCYEKDQKSLCNGIDGDKTSDLRCGECNVKFESITDLENHKLTHKKTYQCIKCQLSFDTENEIQKHVTTHLMTEGSHHECHLCLSVFVSPAKLQCHLIEHTFEGCSNFTCYMCSSVFTSSHAIQQHMLEHGLASRPYDCRQCHLKFFFRAELENHSFVHNPRYTDLESKVDSDLNFQCKECPRTFPTSFHLHNHVKVHESSNPLKNSSNNNHEDLASSIRCSLCPKSFSNSVDMQHHYFNAHNEMEHSDAAKKKVFQCPECDKQFPCLSNLQGHMRIHTQGTKYTCTECNKEFALSRNLNIHMRSHSGEKPYECPICHKRFARKENRKAHIKSHSGLKPFMCPHCGKSFSRKCHVKEHMKVHFNTSANGSPVQSSCEVCSQTFVSVELLKKHLVESHHHDDKMEDDSAEKIDHDDPDEENQPNSPESESSESHNHNHNGDFETGSFIKNEPSTSLAEGCHTSSVLSNQNQPENAARSPQIIA